MVLNHCCQRFVQEHRGQAVDESLQREAGLKSKLRSALATEKELVAYLSQ